MGEAADQLNELRDDIDHIDRELLELLNSPAEIVLEIQRLKHRLGLPSYSAARESEIIGQVRQANRGPLPDGAVEQIFGCILQHSLSSLVQNH
jgi:3-deoxy-7-phosphoheptulonate synthase/chorismate mutase